MRSNLLMTLTISASLAFSITACSKSGAPKDGAMTDTSMASTPAKPMDTVAAKTADTMAAMPAKENPMVGGAAMYANKDIVDNAVNSKDHTTLVAAVKAADLVATLKGAGPFTVFAPTNEAFDKLPKGTVETLVKPENKEKLTKILTYHVVAGKIDGAGLMKQIKDGNGKAMLKTVNGGMITATMDGDRILLTDAKGGKAHVTIGDVYQSNGVIHVIDTVLMPG
ncbi:MAG: Fasciclin [Chlorobi bacterium]|nr:Fasciclin [Chlorobiota bacterium]